MSELYRRRGNFIGFLFFITWVGLFLVGAWIFASALISIWRPVDPSEAAPLLWAYIGLVTLACFVAAAMKQPRARRIAVAVLLVVSLVMPIGCLTTTQTQPGQTSSVLEQVEQVQSIAKSIRWIIPLAEGVIAMFFPQYVPEVGMALASYNGLLATADMLIAQAKGDPASADPAKLSAMLADLKGAWDLLDGGYKADPTAIGLLAGAAA